MADYKLRVDVDEAELTKKLKKAVDKAFGSIKLGGGGSNDPLTKFAKYMDETTKQTDKVFKMNQDLLRTRYKYNSLLQKEVYARQLTMKIEARKNELIRRSGVSGRFGRTVGGLIAGRPGSAVGGMFDELSAMFKFDKDLAKIKRNQRKELRDAANRGDIGPIEYLKKIKETKGLGAEEKKARPMKLVAIGAGLLAGAGISKMIIDSSPLLQAMLKILNVGIMLILRPIGDFVGFLLRPMLIEFVKKVAIPAYKGGFKLAKQWGDSLGKGLLGLLQLLSDPIGAVTMAIAGGLSAFFTGRNPENTSLIGGLAYACPGEGGLQRPDGALTPAEFIGAEPICYKGGGGAAGGIAWSEILMQPLMTFLGKMNGWFLDKGTTLLDDALKSISGFFGKLTALFKGLTSVPEYFKIKMTDLFERISTAVKSISEVFDNVIKYVTTALGKAWNKMSTFFTETIPEKFVKLADDIEKAFKALPKKFADAILEAFERIVYGKNPINEIQKTKVKGGAAGWDPLKDLKKWFTKVNSPAGLGSSTLSFDDIVKAIKGALKDGIKNAGPQIAGELLYWNLADPWLAEKIPGYPGKDEMDKAGDRNWKMMEDFFAGKGDWNWEAPIFGSLSKHNTSCPNMAYACPGETGQLVADTFEEVEGHAGMILDDWINAKGYIACSLNNTKNIESIWRSMKNTTDLSRVSSDITEGHFEDIQKNMGGASDMMAALIKKVTEVLIRARIRSTKDDATGAQKALGRSGAYETWTKDSEGNIQAPGTRKYFIAWFAPDGKSTGHTTTQMLSPQAYSYYNNLKQQGKIKTLYRMARGGIINEPILGFGQNTGKSYLMGESGPETVTPGANTKPGTSGGNTFNITINAKDVGDIERQLKPTILRILKESTSRAGIV